MGKGNTNAKLHRQAKKLARHKSNRAKAKFRRTKDSKSSRRDRAPVFPDEMMLFWLAHGANYLASDYDQGTWTPIFPEIYEEGASFSAVHLVERLKTLYYDETSESWKDGSMSVVGWCLTQRENAFVFYLTVLKLLQNAHPEQDVRELLKLPHQTTVWAYFNDIKKRAIETKSEPNPQPVS